MKARMLTELMRSLNGFAKLKRVLYWVLLIFLVARIVPLHTDPVLAHSEVTLSAWTRVPPTIDGVISKSEWADADLSAFMIGTTIKAIIYVKNDKLNLYLAVHITDDNFGTNASTRDVVEFYFDNDHDGLGPEPGDDKLACMSWRFESFDLFWKEFSGWTWDELNAGADDGIIAATGDGTHNMFELSHPLDSADDDHDFSLTSGDSVGFMIGYIDQNVYAGYWPADAHPNSAPSDWHDIIISGSCTDADVEELTSASEFSSNATIIDFDNLTSGTDVSNQYSNFGVRFLDDNWTTPQINGPVERGCVATSSNPNSLFNRADALDSDSSGIPLTVTFTTPQQKVGFYMGSSGGNETIIANLVAYDNLGEPIGSIGGIASEAIQEFLGIHSPCKGIFIITLNYVDSVLGEEIDDLIFEAFENPPLIVDSDGDGVQDSVDNCPLTYNPWQLDTDGDGVGDECDNCRSIYNPNQTDSNYSGVGDACELTEDLTPPSINLTHTPQQPQANRIVNFTVWAVDPSGIEWVALWINGVNVKNCSESPCIYTGGPYSNRTYVYYAMACDTASNLGISEYRSFTIDHIDYGVLGDLDDDEEISSVDALIAIQMAEGTLPLEDVADIDFDLDVTAEDAFIMLGKTVGLPNLIVSYLEVGEISFEDDMAEVPVEFYVSNDGAGRAGIFSVAIPCYAIGTGGLLTSTFKESENPHLVPLASKELDPPSIDLLHVEFFTGWVEIPANELADVSQIRLIVHADPDDEIHECSEWDNTRVTVIPVQIPIRIHEANPERGTAGRWITISGEGFGETAGPDRGVLLSRLPEGGLGEFEPLPTHDMPIAEWSHTEILAKIPHGISTTNEDYSIAIHDQGSIISNPVPFTIIPFDLDYDGLDDLFEDELMLKYAPYYLFNLGEIHKPCSWEFIASHSQFKKKEWFLGADCLDGDESREGTLWNYREDWNYFNNPGPNSIYLDIGNRYRLGEDFAATEYAHVAPTYDGNMRVIVIEYWKLYPYSIPTTASLGYVNAFSHEGDWERVLVFVDLGGNFLYMIYSHHFESTRTNSPEWYEGTHPKVYVQLGVHAAWPEPGFHGHELGGIQTGVGGWHVGNGANTLGNPINVGEAHYPRNGCGPMLRFNGWWGDADCDAYEDHGPRGPITKGGDRGWHWPPNQPNPWP